MLGEWLDSMTLEDFSNHNNSLILRFDICSQEQQEPVASIGKEEGLEIRVRETGSHRPRHPGMAFHAKKFQSGFSM